MPTTLHLSPLDRQVACAEPINIASKGRNGGRVPLAKDLRTALMALRELPTASESIIVSERCKSMTPAVVFNLIGLFPLCREVDVIGEVIEEINERNRHRTEAGLPLLSVSGGEAGS